jgi:hypothetical protein
MIEPADESDKHRAASDYLHFEDDDLSVPDVYFNSFEEAVDYINDRGWGFASEDWEPSGMLFEMRIECKDRHGSVVGQLLMLTIKITE